MNYHLLPPQKQQIMFIKNMVIRSFLKNIKLFTQSFFMTYYQFHFFF